MLQRVFRGRNRVGRVKYGVQQAENGGSPIRLKLGLANAVRARLVQNCLSVIAFLSTLGNCKAGQIRRPGRPAPTHGYYVEAAVVEYPFLWTRREFYTAALWQDEGGPLHVFQGQFRNNLPPNISILGNQ